jgi:PTH1 family peptidyl-tRNA hydrolase
VIVGLGNPEPKFAGTPHNIGYEVVERLVRSHGLNWEFSTDAWIARGVVAGRTVRFVKIQSAMNRTGAGLKRLSQELSFDENQCILVHDDLNLALGLVRTRLSGGAGGHRGVASILEAFQSDAFRRVKVGVAQADAKLDRIEYVLTTFDAEARATIDEAISRAAVRVVEMLGRRDERNGREGDSASASGVT